MEVTIFAKKKTTQDGKKNFFTYFTTLKKKDGTEITTEVKFRESCGAPNGDSCPMNIMFDKSDANFTEKPVTYTDNEGVEKDAISRKLWISNWVEGSPYVDHSMDDFE